MKPFKAECVNEPPMHPNYPCVIDGLGLTNNPVEIHDGKVYRLDTPCGRFDLKLHRALEVNASASFIDSLLDSRNAAAETHLMEY